MNGLREFKKEHDVKLHQIFHMRNLYWYGSDNYEYDPNETYDNWVKEWYYELTDGSISYCDENCKRELDIEVNDVWEHYRFEILKSIF